MTTPVIIGSERSEVGLPAGMEILRDGGAALDAVEVALRCCENNLADHYVGTGGLPNARGEVELDASLMIASSRAFGAVGAVKGFPNPISIARAVLERLPQHSLIVGEGPKVLPPRTAFTGQNCSHPRPGICFSPPCSRRRRRSKGCAPAPALATNITARRLSTWSSTSSHIEDHGEPST